MFVASACLNLYVACNFSEEQWVTYKCRRSVTGTARSRSSPSLTCSGSNISRRRHSSSRTTPGEISGAALTRSSKCGGKGLTREQCRQVAWQTIRHTAFIGKTFLAVLVARVVGKGARSVEPEIDVQPGALP